MPVIRFVGALMIVVGLAFGVTFVYLNTRYADTLPTSPRPSEGRVYPLSVHGTIVYLTRTEDSTLDFVGIGALAFSLCGGWLSVKKRH